MLTRCSHSIRSSLAFAVGLCVGVGCGDDGGNASEEMLSDEGASSAGTNTGGGDYPAAPDDDLAGSAGTGSAGSGSGSALDDDSSPGASTGTDTSTDPTTTSNGSATSTGSPSVAEPPIGATPSTSTTPPPGELQLFGAPMLFTPTEAGFGISVVVSVGDPGKLGARLRVAGDSAGSQWQDLGAPGLPAPDLAEWTPNQLEPGTDYEYEILDGEEVLYAGTARTSRPKGESFSFALITDSHVGANLNYTNQGLPDVLRAIGEEVSAAAPDFLVNLGDMLDFHQYGFNDPPPNGLVTRSAYLNYRLLLGDSIGNAPHFGVIGNWEGENGNYQPDAIAWSREQRLLYMPNPEPDTYPAGGSEHEDYFAFSWGDALFVVLNVMSYTPTEHLLSSTGGQADEWTLGQDQLDWLRDTLENAEESWKFILIHHAVGGAAGNEANANYGRGGGQAAYVGEQALVHQMMLDYGVQIFFYGHDHVFTDMVVDGVHYSMPGSAGAPWMFTQAETGYETSWQVSGWAHVDVSPDSVDVQFIEVGGEVIHSYELDPDTPIAQPELDAGSSDVDASVTLPSEAGPERDASAIIEAALPTAIEAASE